VSEPCQQEGKIARLEATDTSILETLKEIKETNKRFIEVLEKIAAQGARIDSLEHLAKKQRSDINALFSRIRELEMIPGREGASVKIGLIMAALSALVSFFVAKVLR
jgi:septal ring factor EnvC (AmiA/AmiB activator)